MAAGATNYTSTPWGLFSQQQFLLLLMQQYMCCAGLSVLSKDDINTAAADMAYFYSYAWPLVQGMDL